MSTPSPTMSQPQEVANRIEVVDAPPFGLGSVATIDQDWDSKRDLSGPFVAMTVLVKDSIDVAGVPTTGGSAALVDSVPDHDADIVRNLRASGIGVVGKTHLHELCGWVTFRSPSGFSELGGIPRNPYGHQFTPGGSSSGSGVAAAAELTTIAIGTDTGGSVLQPAARCSLFGLRPSTGLLSTRGMLPVTSAQDTPGPMGRTVAHIAAGLGAMTGGDPEQYLRALDSRAGRNAVVGVAIRGATEEEGGMWSAAVATLMEAGVNVRPLPVPVETAGVGDLIVPAYDFRNELGGYLAGLGKGRPIRDFAQLYAHYADASADRQPYGIDNLRLSARVDLRADRPVRDDVWRREHDSARRSLDDARHRFGLDAILFPGHQAAYVSSKSGYPAIALPAGYLPTGQPFGVSVVATERHAEQMLLDLAAVWEATSPPRRSPWASLSRRPTTHTTKQYS